MKKRFQIIFFVLLAILLIERLLIYVLNANILRGNVHLNERLNSEEVNWDSIFKTKDWSCKSYDHYIYKYHTCFRDFGDVPKYYYHDIRPYLTLSRIIWPTDDNFRYIDFSVLGYNEGTIIGYVLLNGIWERCSINKNFVSRSTDSSYCGDVQGLKLMESGVWNNDYVK